MSATPFQPLQPILHLCPLRQRSTTATARVLTADTTFPNRVALMAVKAPPSALDHVLQSVRPCPDTTISQLHCVYSLHRLEGITIRMFTSTRCLRLTLPPILSRRWSTRLINRPSLPPTPPLLARRVTMTTKARTLRQNKKNLGQHYHLPVP